MNSIIHKISSLVTALENKYEKRTLSLIYVALSTITFTVLYLFNKMNLASVDIVQAQIWRGLIMALLYAWISNANGQCLAVTDKRLNWINFWRNFLGVIMNIITFFLLSKLPASLVAVITMVNSLMIAYLDYVMYKTHYSKSEIFYTILTIFGVILIINPKIIMFWKTDLTDAASISDDQYVQGYEKIFWIVAHLIGVALWSFSVALIKKLQSVPITTMNFTFGFFLSTMAGIVQLFHQNATPIDLSTLLQIILFVGIFSIIDQMSYIRALQLGKPGTLNVLKNSYVVFVFLFEVIYLKEYPSLYSLLGSILIVFCSVKLTLNRAKK